MDPNTTTETTIRVRPTLEDVRRNAKRTRDTKLWNKLFRRVRKPDGSFVVEPNTHRIVGNKIKKLRRDPDGVTKRSPRRMRASINNAAARRALG